MGRASSRAAPQVEHGLLGCGLPGVRAVDYVGWLEPLWTNPPAIRDGLISPPTGAGLGADKRAICRPGERQIGYGFLSTLDRRAALCRRLTKKPNDGLA